MYQITNQFLSKEWIMEKWDAGFYITAAAGARASPPHAISVTSSAVQRFCQ